MRLFICYLLLRMPEGRWLLVIVIQIRSWRVFSRHHFNLTWYFWYGREIDHCNDLFDCRLHWCDLENSYIQLWCLWCKSILWLRARDCDICGTCFYYKYSYSCCDCSTYFGVYFACHTFANIRTHPSFFIEATSSSINGPSHVMKLMLQFRASYWDVRGKTKGMTIWHSILKCNSMELTMRLM